MVGGTLERVAELVEAVDGEIGTDWAGNAAVTEEVARRVVEFHNDLLA